MPVAAIDWPWVALALSIFLLVFTRFWHLASYSLDGDEIFSVQAASNGWRQMLSVVAIDLVHPPLFYALLKIWMAAGGETVVWLRLLPAILGVASVFPLLALCRTLGLERLETAVVVFLFSVNGYLISYSQQARMYSLLLFCSATSIYLFTKYLNSEKDSLRLWAGLSFVNLLLVYAHYFGWLVVAIEGLALLLWNRRRVVPYVISVGALVLCYLPWVFAVLKAAPLRALHPPAWIVPPTIKDLVWFYVGLNGTFEFPRSTTLSIAIFGFPLLLWAWRIFRERDPNETRVTVWLGLLAFLPAIVIFCISKTMRSVWGERHLIISAIPYLMLIVVSIGRLRTNLLRIPLLILILFWSGLSGFKAVTTPDRKLQWDAWAGQILNHTSISSEPVTIFTLEEFVTIPLEFYRQRKATGKLVVIRIRDLSEVSGQHFWVAFRNTTWKGPQPPQVILSQQGYHIGDSIEVAAGEQKITAFSVSRTNQQK